MDFFKNRLGFKLILVLAGVVLWVQCNTKEEPVKNTADGVKLLVPEGFEVTVVADSVGEARHIAVNDNGDIYVKLKRYQEEGGLVALRDTDGDGRADIIKQFGQHDKVGRFHSGVNIHNGYLYFSTDIRVYRYKLTPGELVPDTELETIVIDDHEHGSHEHINKPITFDDRGYMYIPFGVHNNACQEPKRTPGVPGLDPCPYLDKHGGVWRFDADRHNQTQADGRRIVTGIRNIAGIDWNPDDGRLYATMHGRDNLHRLFPNRFSEWDNAVLPSEEFLRLTEGADFGWPYCYYDHIQGKKVLAPEYGGDGKIVGRCSQYDDPIIGFPGHFAPNDMMFYHGDQFPEHYRGGAFVMFHGSTIRNPYPQAGYFLGFVPFEDGEPSGDWEVFANGFAGVDPVVSVSDAIHRPGGLAVGPDGSLYVTEDRKGTIWRIRFTGDREQFGPAQLARMEREKQTASNIRRPHPVEDNLQKGVAVGGEKLYNTYCASCHQRDGKGTDGRYPPLAGSDWVTGSKKRLIEVVLDGMEGPIEVNGETYNGIMPQHSFLSDEDAAEVLTYVRQNFGNWGSEVTAEEVQRVRHVSIAN